MCGSLGRFTTFGIGGDADAISVCKTRRELIAKAGKLVLGGGSNVLVSDRGYRGEVVINRYSRITLADKLIVVGSGTRLGSICSFMKEHSLCGMEWAAGIPGTAGGVVKMNAGAFGGCIADCIVYADVVINGTLTRLSKNDLDLSYRHSAIGDGDTVIDVAFGAVRGDAIQIASRMKEFAGLRKSTQPEAKSAGSIFKNPKGISIGAAIERAGFKGYRVGGAKVSERHANMIVNTGGATAADVLAIIRAIKAKLEKMGIRAQEEIVYIGDF